MARQVNIINYFPQILREYREIIEIAVADNPELNAQWQAIENFYNDMFCDSLTENGCKRWESILKIVPKDTDSIEDRQFRIKSRLNEKLPYTMNVLNHQLTTLCGENGYSLERNLSTHTIKVRVALIVKAQYDAVGELLERIRPCNTVIDLSLLYNQHSTLANFTHSHLHSYTCDQLRNEVIS